MSKKFWLMKSEPDVFSIDDLKNRPQSTEHWDGVRNYQARNFMRDDMKKGDQILFYHSSCKPPGVAGIAKVASDPYPDHTAFDKKSKYFDPKSDPEKPRWIMIDVKFVQKFKQFVPLEQLKNQPQLSQMKLLQKGNRLSIMPITEDEFNFILNLSK